MSERDGCYLLNFFNAQPALNFGFNRIDHPDWQIPYTDDRVKPVFEEILSVMRFWLDRGCDGFRVDMAASLVKTTTGTRLRQVCGAKRAKCWTSNIPKPS